MLAIGRWLDALTGMYTGARCDELSRHRALHTLSEHPSSPSLVHQRPIDYLLRAQHCDKLRGETDISLNQWFSNMNVPQNTLEGLLKHRLLGPIPKMSNLAGRGWEPITYISNKFPGDAGAAGPETKLGRPLLSMSKY